MTDIQIRISLSAGDGIFVADAQPPIVIDRVGERGLFGISADPGIVPALHVIEQIGRDARFASVVFVGHLIERIDVDSRKLSVVVVRSHYTQFPVRCIHGLFGSLLGRRRSRIDQPHGHPQFERIGELDPFFDISGVDLVGSRRDRRGAMFRQRGNRSIQLFENLFVDLPLGIQRSRNLPVRTDPAVRDRPVGVGHALESRSLDDLPYGKDRFVFRCSLQAEPVGIDVGNDFQIHFTQPVLRRIEIGERVGPHLRVGEIAAPHAAHQALGELIQMLLDGNHIALHTAEQRADEVFVALRLLRRNLRPVAVVVHVVSGTRTRQSSAQEADAEAYLVVCRFHGTR